MVQLASLLADKLTGTANVGARPATNQDGIDITTWKSGSFMPRVAVVIFSAAALSTLSPVDGTFASGAELWGYITALAKWAYVGQVLQNGGNVVVIGGDLAVLELDDLAPFDRLAIAGTASTAATYRFAPLETCGGGL